MASAYISGSGGSLPPRTAGGQFRKKIGPGGMVLWYGEEVGLRVTEAAVIAVKKMTDAAAAHARSNHPWQNRTGELENSIFSDDPVVHAGYVRGKWGALSPALYLELGTHKMPAYPFLRPAADAVYGQAAWTVALMREALRQRA